MQNTKVDDSKNCTNLHTCNENEITHSPVKDSKGNYVQVSVDSFIEKVDALSMNESPVREAIKNSTTFVQGSNCGTQKYSCKYCQKLVAKVVRHIETIHKD